MAITNLMKLKSIFTPMRLTLVALAAFTLPSVGYAEDWTYTVRPGDTLWGLCKSFTKKPNCWQNVGPYNSVEYPRTLKPGTRIRFPVEWLKLQPRPAIITHIEGTAHLVTGTKTRTPLKPGDTLSMGARVVTGSNSLVNILFGNGATMSMDGNTDIAFDQLTINPDSAMVDTKVNLEKGSVQTKVPKRRPAIQFEVHTPSAVAAVRGTNFRVTAELNEDKQVTRNEVFEGKVNVSKEAQTIPVPASYGLLATNAGPLHEKVRLLPAPKIRSPRALVKQTQQAKKAEKAKANNTTKPLEKIQPPTFDTASLEIKWKKVRKSDHYKIQLFKQKSNALIWSKVSKATTAASPELQDGCYELRVSGVDKQKFQGMPSENSFCIEAKIFPPKGVAVTNTSIHWQPAANAKSYKLHFSKDENFKDTYTKETSDVFFEMNDLKQYKYFRIQAVNQNGEFSELSENHTIEPYSERTRGLIFFIVSALLIFSF